MRVPLYTLLLLSLARTAGACDACRDADLFQSSLIKSVEASAATTAAAAPEVAQPVGPRERSTTDTVQGLPPNEAPTRRPSNRIRSFNELN